MGRSARSALLAVQLGVLQDVEVGDPVLDRRFRFSASDTSELRRALTGERARAALLALSDTERFRWIVVRKGSCTATWMPSTLQRDGSPEVVRTRFERMVALLTALGDSPGSFD